MIAIWSPVTAGLISGLVWASWHVRLFLMEGYFGQASIQPVVWRYFATFVFLETLYAWIYDNTERSVLAAVLFHGGINPIAAYFPTGGVDAVGTLTGYGSYALVLLGAVVVLLGIYGPRQLVDRPRVTLSDLLTTDSETTR